MLAIPAIDLIEGRCVRLTEGAFDSIRVYGDDPADIARAFAEAGARRLHVVDLDAARGTGNNRRSIAKIRASFPGILDVGGGVRSLNDILELRSIDVDLIVIGTALVKSPDEAARWASKAGPVLAAGIDARGGEVKTSGWQEGSSVRAVELAARARELGMVEIIYTDIARDGTLSGPNIPETLAVADASGLRVIISGGVGSLKDLEPLARSRPKGIKGVILGKSLYEGTVHLPDALSLLEGTP